MNRKQARKAAEAIVEGLMTEEALDGWPAERADAVRRELARLRRRPQVVELIGRITARSARAVKFAATRVAGEATGEFGAPTWWPLSQVEVVERGYGPADILRVPAWLVEARRREGE